MLISIILPTYNVEKYVIRCLNSIISQSDDDIEIIIIDDGSSDNTVQIINQELQLYKEKNIRFYIKENGGVSSARNLGLQKAKGEYIVFMDSDDVMQNGCLKEMKKAITEKIADLYVFGFDLVFNDGSVSKTWTSEIENFCIDNVDSIGVICEYLKKTNCELSWYPWGKIYKKSIIDANELKFDTKLICCNDFDFVFRYMLYCTNLVYKSFSTVLYSVTREGAITSSRKLRNIKTDCISYYGVFTEVSKYSSSKERDFVLSYISKYYVYNLVSCSGFSKQEEKELKTVIKEQKSIYTYVKEIKFILRRIIFSILGLKRGAIFLKFIHRR